MSAGHELTPEQAQTLQSHVEVLMLGLQSLAVLLVREREALTHGVDHDALEAIARDKQAMVDQVGSLYALLRGRLSTRNGRRASFAQGLGALKRSYPALAQRVEQLLKLTRDCQRANQDNEVLVSEGLNKGPVEPGTGRDQGGALAALS